MYGETAAMRRRVGQLREQALEIRQMADRLVARAEAVPWHGRAAESMRLRIKERAAHLREAAGLHETAADTLGRHVQEVDRRQDAIAVVERKVDSLVGDARARLEAARQTDPDVEPEPEDAPLLAFEPPPPGHRDWLDVELPGL
ncbi:hypothetical protein [Nocardioides solisilvae]|uniref:hypothetical protein n=1 Tax=Nocardioides solisilvae TaxID=1542435 RepID=UPI000D74E1F2|nr:hypothetical protein [Nocardioides solisilvae]